MATTPHHAGNPSLEFKEEDETKKMKIPAKDLHIVWGKDNRYWKVPDDDGSPAELNQVCWLEVTACVAKTNPDMKYEVGFEVSFAPHAFGWGNSPLFVMVKRGKHGKFVWTKHRMLRMQGGHDDRTVTKLLTATVSPDKDKDRKENSDDDSSDKLYFGLYEVWSGKWKGGLKIHHAFVQEFMPSTTTTSTTTTSTPSTTTTSTTTTSTTTTVTT